MNLIDHLLACFASAPVAPVVVNYHPPRFGEGPVTGDAAAWLARFTAARTRRRAV